MAAESPAKRRRVAPDASVDELRSRIAELEQDLSRARGRSFPATDSGAPIRPITYPAYDLASPKESFLAVGDFLVSEVCADLPGYEMPAAEVSRVRRMLQYNLKGGKMNRGLMVVESGVQILRSQGRKADNESVVKLAILGWCIEWIQACLLVADDIMDDSLTRRGQPCWYRQPDVKLCAVNDALMIEMLTFKILKRFFSTDESYIQLVDLLQETLMQTECGQMLDTLCDNLTLKDFTVDRWGLIVKYKTAFYSFYAPVALAMLYTGIRDRSEYVAAREILVIMGVYFQAQDDYLDCFATPEVLGKIGTDIQDKKCGWLFVHAYQSLASPEQKAMLDELYGRCKVQSPEEERVRKLYESLGLKDLYLKYEEESYAKVVALKPTVKQVPWGVFEAFLKKIYKRAK